MIKSALICLLMTLWGLGCSQQPETQEMAGVPVPASVTSAEAIREVTASELQNLVSQDARPLLVEFSVTSGCFRCDEMNSPMRQKTPEILRYADMIRVNYNTSPRLVREAGATVCPSYAVYSGGEIVSIRSWPTSPDLVLNDVFNASENRRMGVQQWIAKIAADQAVPIVAPPKPRGVHPQQRMATRSVFVSVARS
ncbi:MAG: hypothetical protein NXI04_08045 [Planctomycetaceae bacterium]|nr:hypothetical protein [Planctomycetaceae bacterium]